MGGAALQARRAHLPQMRPPHGAAQGHIIYACISLVLGSDISNASVMSISRGGYHEACGDKSSHMTFVPGALHTSATISTYLWFNQHRHGMILHHCHSIHKTGNGDNGVLRK
jgi:hypothetical protein